MAVEKGTAEHTVSLMTAIFEALNVFIKPTYVFALNRPYDIIR
jgi:hypothetical protein